jgi:hypothetical protein
MNLERPYEIQLFLNQLKYNAGKDCKSPKRVLEVGTAHCSEGAYFAASALRQLGYRPLVVDLAAENDDDHVIAVFQQHQRWGCIAKSNTTLLRFREPVYRSIRELVMSFFDLYFNIKGEKSLKKYSLPLDLSMFDDRDWMSTDDDLNYVSEHLGGIKHFSVLSRGIRLEPADESLVEACFLGSAEEGLYKPRE